VIQGEGPEFKPHTTKKKKKNEEEENWPGTMAPSRIQAT
jgi:hypothetical protein